MSWLVKPPAAIQSAPLSSEASPKVSAFEQRVFADGHYEAHWSSKFLIYDAFLLACRLHCGVDPNPVDPNGKYPSSERCEQSRIPLQEPAFMTDRFAAALCAPNRPPGGKCAWSITAMHRRSVRALECFTTHRPREISQPHRCPHATRRAPWWSAAPNEVPHPHGVFPYHSEMLSEDAECFTTI